MAIGKKSSAKTETIETNDPKQTHVLGRKMGRQLAVGDCIALVGELGAGKTALVRGLAEGFGCEKQMVSSPSYVLVQEYPGRDHAPFYHIDLYRLRDPEMEFADLGVEEMLLDGVVVIEWADRAEPALPVPRRRIAIEILGKTSRRWIIADVE